MTDIAATAAPLRRGGEYGIGGALLLGAGVVAAAYLLAAPLGTLLTAAFRGPPDFLPFEDAAYWTLDNLATVYGWSSLYTTVIPNTAIFVIGSVFVGFLIAFTLAWLVERTDLPGRGLIFTLSLFPLLVPTVILAIAWIFLFGPNAGWVNTAVRATFGLEGSGPFNIFSMTGLILAQGVALVPFMFLLFTAALRSMNPSLEEASLASGASPFRTFWRVTLPVLRPGILAPVILAALIAMEQFELPLIIGLPARVYVFASQIFFELNPDTDLPAYGRAAAIALPFLMVGIVLLIFYNRLIRRSESFVTVTGKGYRPTRFRLGKWRWPALGFVFTYLAFATILPTLVLVWTSLYKFNLPSWEILPEISFEAYRELFTEERFYRSVYNTFIVAFLSATIVTLVGSLLAWILVRTRIPGRRIVDFVSFASIGIPSVIAGFAAMVLYLSLPIGVYGTIWVLVLAYSYRFAVTTRLSRAGLMQLHQELEEASYTSGASWLTTLRRVILPLMAPSLTASFILLFIIGFREFTIAVILLTEENMVLSVILWRLWVNTDLDKAAAVATLIILFIVPVVFLARRMFLPREAEA